MQYRTYDDRNDVAEAVEAYLTHGFAVIDCASSRVFGYESRMIGLIKHEHDKDETTPLTGYINIPGGGNYYFVYDAMIFANSYDPRLLEFIRKIDATSDESI